MSDDKIIRSMGSIVASRAEKPFIPSPAQKQARSQLWTRGGDTLPTEPNLASAARFVDDKGILEQSWTQPGFQAWLWNRSEFDERLDYLSHLVLDKFESILISASSSDSAKLTAAKMILEAGKKMGKSSDGAEFADEKINKMDRKQLEDFIQKSIKLVSGPDTGTK